MILKLGIVSGEILVFLEEKKESVSIRDIHLTFGYPKETICMAIGWLTREGIIHVDHDIDKGKFMVSLMKNKKRIPGEE
jgi:hypothetical protein